jgi:16S rRNA C967 or C1407 C5-methylase (RsmB/RsmF family)/NOL1/NOP2/fmu family ribosome biogenesis protein
MNELFLSDMKRLLQDEYPAFLATLDDPIKKAIRLNTLKTDAKILDQLTDQPLKAAPFASETYYLPDKTTLGNHPYHQAGLFYLQEPSATAAVTALDVRPNDKVIDLCAAPGGKSTQILSALKGQGLLWSNEIDSKRCQTLLSNLERWGADNYVLSNETPLALADNLASCFNKVLVDAPCSGGAMYKKYAVIDRQYSEAGIASCARRQKEILDQAYRLLAVGGVMVYSTCTYDIEENEENIAAFLNRYPDMELVSTGLNCGRCGLPVKGADGKLMRRITPMDGGEGHFIAKMVKTKTDEVIRNFKTQPSVKDKIVDQFLMENKITVPYLIYRMEVWATTTSFVKYPQLHIVRQGVLVGRLDKGRLKPEHHFYLSLLGCQVPSYCNLSDPLLVSRFLKGEVLPVTGYKGYTAIAYNGVTLGFGKGDGTQIKNHYPKGLRH